MVFICAGAFSQPAETLSLEECLRLSTARSPLKRQQSISGEIYQFKRQNLKSQWLPSIGINAQASYNSETVDFSEMMENLPVSIPSLPLDQYKAWADINQQLYDGGAVKARKAIEKSTYETEIQQVATELEGIKQQVIQVYFSLLLTDKSTEVLTISLEELDERKKTVLAGVENGVLLPENMLSMQAEELRMEQKLDELKLSRIQLFHVLSVLTDSAFKGDIPVENPAEPVSFDKEIYRPELVLFEKQKEKFTASQRLVSSTWLPRFFAFSQAAYGRPGYNSVSRDFHAFYSLGVGMKWNFLNYGDNRRQVKILDLQKEYVDTKLEVFDDQLSIQLETERVNMEKFNEMLLKDEQIISLRKAIASASFAKLNNGVITSSDYLKEMNAELLAVLQYENHKLLKLQAAFNYLLWQGKL